VDHNFGREAGLNSRASLGLCGVSARPEGHAKATWPAKQTSAYSQINVATKAKSTSP
jgi:hypothetical protein